MNEDERGGLNNGLRLRTRPVCFAPSARKAAKGDSKVCDSESHVAAALVAKKREKRAADAGPLRVRLVCRAFSHGHVGHAPLYQTDDRQLRPPLSSSLLFSLKGCPAYTTLAALLNGEHETAGQCQAVIPRREAAAQSLRGVTVSPIYGANNFSSAGALVAAIGATGSCWSDDRGGPCPTRDQELRPSGLVRTGSPKEPCARTYSSGPTWAARRARRAQCWRK